MAKNPCRGSLMILLLFTKGSMVATKIGAEALAHCGAPVYKRLYELRLIGPRPKRA